MLLYAGFAVLAGGGILEIAPIPLEEHGVDDPCLVHACVNTLVKIREGQRRLARTLG